MNNINNAVMAETGLDQYSAQQRKELLTQIAGFAASSSNKSKSGGGYMGLVKKAGGGMMPIKFLTRYKERGAHYDRTIVENCLNEDNKVFFTASETLERILLDLAAKAGDAAKKEVQDMLSDWRTKSGCGGKTLLSRNVVFKAVKAINNELKDEDKADLAHLKTEGSWGDTSLSTIRQRLSGQMNKGDTDKLRKALKTAHAKSTKVVDAMAKTKSTINGLKDAKFGGDLTEGERELLRKIRSAETLPKDDTKAGHGYMGLTISDGALVPLRFLTHYSERGAHTDRTIMKDVADKGNVGVLAFKSSELLEEVMLKLAAKVRCEKAVSGLFEAWKMKSKHNDKTLLSRDVVFQAAQVIANGDSVLGQYNAGNKGHVLQLWQQSEEMPLPAKSDTRIEQLNSLDAKENLQTLERMLKDEPNGNADNNANINNNENIGDKVDNDENAGENENIDNNENINNINNIDNNENISNDGDTRKKVSDIINELFDDNALDEIVKVVESSPDFVCWPSDRDHKTVVKEVLNDYGYRYVMLMSNSMGTSNAAIKGTINKMIHHLQKDFESIGEKVVQQKEHIPTWIKQLEDDIKALNEEKDSEEIDKKKKSQTTLNDILNLDSKGNTLIGKKFKPADLGDSEGENAYRTLITDWHAKRCEILVCWRGGKGMGKGKDVPLDHIKKLSAALDKKFSLQVEDRED